MLNIVIHAFFPSETILQVQKDRIFGALI